MLSCAGVHDAGVHIACVGVVANTGTCCAPVVFQQVVFVTTEVAPWSKVGGLGDVMAALPAALAAR
jgi:NAD(P)H-hydrate repair Nnr-like enzyme with NAD(P)H-hydrate dehydratase domain